MGGGVRMLAKELSVQLMRWNPNNYSENRNHDHELEWYLWFEGREAYRLFDKGPSDLLPAPGYFGRDGLRPMIHPCVVNNKFKVRLVAIERDGPQWLDPDDRANGEITIDMDKFGPYTTWSVIAADPQRTDLNVQVWFDIKGLEYVNAPEIPKEGLPTIDNTTNSPYPWDDSVHVFEHEMGLGKNSSLRLTSDKLISRREMLIFTRQGPRTNIQETYRFNVASLGIPNDTMSSIFVPKQTAGRLNVTLYNHDFGDPRFGQSQNVTLSRWGLQNLGRYGMDDRVSSVEVVKTYPKTIPSPVN